MTINTVTLNLPTSGDNEQAPLGLLRAALVVAQHAVDYRCRYDFRDASMRETATLLRTKMHDVLCFIELYEHKLDTRPADSNHDVIF